MPKVNTVTVQCPGCHNYKAIDIDSQDHPTEHFTLPWAINCYTCNKDQDCEVIEVSWVEPAK